MVIKEDVYTDEERADAIVRVTEGPEFREIDWSRVQGVMRGSFVLDGRNSLDSVALIAAGLDYASIGGG